ncbi:MAG: GNAT family N-acetyltransferase [Actinobacteria bacterium]|nr:GNAT family N-acetyltransferase [Actinomycetota bacterium]
MPEIELAPAARDDPAVLTLYEPFAHESGAGLTETAAETAAEAAAGPPADLVPPAGAMLLVRVDGEPAGIGGVRHLDTPIAEIKSMYVSPAHRGLGLGRRILEQLQAIARERGCRAVRLDSNDYLREAVGLYRAAGYREVADYNGNAKADLWFELEL